MVERWDDPFDQLDDSAFDRSYVRAVDAFLAGEFEFHPFYAPEISGESATWIRAYLADLLRNASTYHPIYNRLKRGRRLDNLLENIEGAGKKVKVIGQSQPSLRFPSRISFRTDHPTIRTLGLTMLPHEGMTKYSFLLNTGVKYLVYGAFVELEDAHAEAGGKPNPDLKRYFSGQLDQLADRYKE